MFFGVALLVSGWGVVGWGRNYYLGPTVIFSNWDLRWRNKHDSFWLVVSAGYFYILFLWAIVVSDLFSCLVSLLQPTTKQITISINIFICLKFYTVWNQIIHFKVFNIQVRFKCENGLRKNSLWKKIDIFSVDYVKINELHVVHTWHHMQSE